MLPRVVNLPAPPSSTFAADQPRRRNRSESAGRWTEAHVGKRKSSRSPNQHKASDKEGDGDVAGPETKLGEEDTRVALDEPIGDCVVEIATYELSDDNGDDGNAVAGRSTCSERAKSAPSF